MTAKPDSTNAAIVDPDYHWRPMSTCPKNTKVQLLTRYGCAIYGQWNGIGQEYTDWAPLPTKRKEK